MNIKIFGDLHLTNNDIIDKPVLEFLIANIKKDDMLVFLGDIFHSFDTGLRNESFYNFLSQMENIVYIILGNHDISQNRFSIQKNVINNFSKRVTAINEYGFVDVQNVRLHFYNYFRRGKFKTDLFFIDREKINILCSHMDLRVDSQDKVYKDFRRVVNGHIHDFENGGNAYSSLVNLGAVRQVAVNESPDKKFVTIIPSPEDNDFKFKYTEFKTPVDIKKVILEEIESVVIYK